VFGRNKSSSEAEPSPVEPTDGLPGKGRPTPTRKEAEAARKLRTTPPRTRKEINAKRREAMKASRSKQRAALDGQGDDAYLPTRDQGPVKAFVRDWIDARRTIGEFMLPIFFAVFILVYVNTPWAQRFSSTAFLAVMVLLIFDSVRIIRGLKRALKQRFPDTTEKFTMYALMRSWQMRRLRLPKPRVKPGAQV